MPCAASGESSRNGLPGSSSVCTRSRGSSLPREVCLRARVLAAAERGPLHLRAQVRGERAHARVVRAEPSLAGSIWTVRRGMGREFSRISFDRHRDCFAAADAQRGDAALQLPCAPSAVNQRRQDARAGGADRDGRARRRRR